MGAGDGFEPPTSGLWTRRASELLYPAIFKGGIFFRSEPPRPHMKGNENRISGWYQRWELNPRPPPYEGGALNQLSYSGISRHIKIKSTLYSSNIRLIVFIIVMNKIAVCVLWRLQGDLNPWPPAWQAGVLTNWTMKPYRGSFSSCPGTQSDDWSVLRSGFNKYNHKQNPPLLG